MLIFRYFNCYIFLWIVSCSIFLFVLCVYFSVLFHFVIICVARNLSYYHFLHIISLDTSFYFCTKIKIVTKRRRIAKVWLGCPGYSLSGFFMFCSYVL